MVRLNAKMKSSFGSVLFVIDQLVFGGICGVGGVLCDDGGVIIVSRLMVLNVFGVGGVGGVPDSGSLCGSNGATFAGVL